jgi:hypothetical protein
MPKAFRKMPESFRELSDQFKDSGFRKIYCSVASSGAVQNGIRAAAASNDDDNDAVLLQSPLSPL